MAALGGTIGVRAGGEGMREGGSDGEGVKTGGAGFLAVGGGRESGGSGRFPGEEKCVWLSLVATVTETELEVGGAPMAGGFGTVGTVDTVPVALGETALGATDMGVDSIALTIDVSACALELGVVSMATDAIDGTTLTAVEVVVGGFPALP